MLSTKDLKLIKYAKWSLPTQEPVEEFLEALPPPPSEKKKRKKKTKIKKPETIEDLKVLRKCTGKIFTGDI